MSDRLAFVRSSLSGTKEHFTNLFAARHRALCLAVIYHERTYSTGWVGCDPREETHYRWDKEQMRVIDYAAGNE